MVGATVGLGISHPSGQPLFHLLGKLFLLLPARTAAWRLGLMSAACSALASVLFWFLSCRLAAASTRAASSSPLLKTWLLLLALGWSFSLPWWRYSLVPLVYALHLLLALLVLWALSLEKPGKWPLAFLILGAATVFRPTQFFALPFVVPALLWEKRKVLFQKAGGLTAALPSVVFWAAAFALGRSTLLYLPLRSSLHPAIAYADLTHPVELFRHVFALKFSKFVGGPSLFTVLEVLRQMGAHFWADLTPVGAAFLLWGAGMAWWKRESIPAFAWVGWGWGLLEMVFVLTIPFPAFESHQMLLGWVFSGFLAVLPLAFLKQSARRGRYRSAWVAVLLGLFVLAQFSSIGHLLARKGERGAQDYARNLLETMEPGALYVPSEENEYFPVVGYQQSFGFRDDVRIVEPGASPALVGAQIKECLESGRALYVTRKWALPPGWGYQARGPLLKVTRALAGSSLRKAPAVKPLVSWGGVELLGAELRPSRVEAGGKVELTYRWVRRTAGPQDSSDMVVAVFIDPQGNYWMKNGVFWLHDVHEMPEGSPAGMKPGFVYEDKRILFIPSDFPPGDYALAVGLQKQASPLERGRESFDREFYERDAYQNLDKFMGRGEDGAVVQFSAASSCSWKDGLWPVTRSPYPLADPRFVPVAGLRILPADARR